MLSKPPVTTKSACSRPIDWAPKHTDLSPRADFIDGCAWDVQSDSSSYGYPSSWGLSQTCPQYVAEDNFIYFFGVEVYGLKSSFHGKFSQLDSLEGGQFAVKAADGSS